MYMYNYIYIYIYTHSVLSVAILCSPACLLYLSAQNVLQRVCGTEKCQIDVNMTFWQLIVPFHEDSHMIIIIVFH